MTDTVKFCSACFNAQRDPFHKGDECPVHKGELEARNAYQALGVELPANLQGLVPRSTAEPQDAVYHPPHYARWAMEPIEFIAINNLPWWVANVIKYTMRFDAKDGLQDLYKARSYLDMKINQLEGHERFWDKPVTDERKANGAA